MTDYITIRVYRPEGYEDVAAPLVLDDFLRNTSGFKVELIESRPSEYTK